MSNPECRGNIDRDCCGLRDTLAVILRLQENVAEVEETLATCDRPFLGPQPTNQCFNTRPVVLYTCQNTIWEMPIEDDCPTTSSYTFETESDSLTNFNDTYVGKGKEKCIPETSTVFRVEKLGPCTATFRVLIPIKKGSKCMFKKTNTFFTVNLCCLGAIRCLPDTFIAGVC